MMEVVLASLTLLSLLIHAALAAIRANNLKESLRLEGEQMKANLDHVAGAVIGLSELLDDADGIIEDVSKIPTTGEVIMQMVQQMIMSKITPSIMPFAADANLISGLLSPAEHAETQESDDSQTE
jgi:hypothetical protein